MDTVPRNQQMVGKQNGDIVVYLLKSRMHKREALEHAAFIVALADDEDEFSDILETIRTTVKKGGLER